MKRNNSSIFLSPRCFFLSFFFCVDKGAPFPRVSGEALAGEASLRGAYQWYWEWSGGGWARAFQWCSELCSSCSFRNSPRCLLLGRISDIWLTIYAVCQALNGGRTSLLSGLQNLYRLFPFSAMLFCFVPVLPSIFRCVRLRLSSWHWWCKWRWKWRLTFLVAISYPVFGREWRQWLLPRGPPNSSELFHSWCHLGEVVYVSWSVPSLCHCFRMCVLWSLQY